jgi:PucR family transcriptional regulator, purine catabolism regulatory protein
LLVNVERHLVAEITLRDLCRWDRRLHLLAPAGMSLDAALDRPVSWVVSVRTSPPLLPALRGDELVVVSRRVLEQIENAHVLGRNELLTTRSGERIAALLTEPGFTEDPLESLPVLTMPAPFPHDAEGTLNRLLTERRAELYRLGNELSRRLSQASMDPRGVEGLLDVAADVAGKPLVLQDSDGHVLAHGGPELDEHAGPHDLLAARNTAGPVIVNAGDRERLILSLSTASGLSYLSMTAPAETLTEADRLVLTQTAGTAAIVMAQGNAVGTRGMRQQAVAEILLGRLTSEAAVNARARGLGLDPAVPFVVGLISTVKHGSVQAERFADQLLGGLSGIERAQIDGQIALVMTEGAWRDYPASATFRVEYGETDGQGRVYYANYLSFFDRGRLAQRGHHRDLVAQPGPYQRLHASWAAKHGTAFAADRARRSVRSRS